MIYDRDRDLCISHHHLRQFDQWNRHDCKTYFTPQSEPLCTWVLSALASLCTLKSAGKLDVVILAYPMYLFVLSTTIPAASLLGKARATKTGLVAETTSLAPWPPQRYLGPKELPNQRLAPPKPKPPARTHWQPSDPSHPHPLAPLPPLS